MKITIELLEKYEACEEGIDWFNAQEETDLAKVCDKLLAEDYFDWANWLLSRILSKDNKIRYAIHAAELVLHVFEEKYPDDDRPRKAIEAAKEYLKNQSDIYAAYAA